MAKLGFLGLGLMGYPMARNLLHAGHTVALWSNTAAKATQLAAEVNAVNAVNAANADDAVVCPTPAAVASRSDVVFLCVGNTEMVEQILLGKNGVIESARHRESGRQRLIVVDASTISASASCRIGEAFAAAGADFLGAPVTGSTPGATTGTLTFMVGGDQKVYQQVLPLLEVLGKKLYYCGGPGAGLHAKLTQNLILSNILQAFNEGIVLSTKAGVPPELMLDILSSSAAKSGLIEYKAPFMLRRDFTTNFSVKWMHKDIGLMLDAGEELSVPLPLTALTHQMFQAAISKGYGEEDICSTIKVSEEFAGVQVRASRTE